MESLNLTKAKKEKLKNKINLLSPAKKVKCIGLYKILEEIYDKNFHMSSNVERIEKDA